MVFIPLLFLTLLINANAGCDNSCSGHGDCMQRGICDCYDNWGLGLSLLSGDCSERICPFEFAWIDTPDKMGTFHKYAECANRGICNRETGECECFPGYEGKACARTACPNDCSGHGRCTYIENMPYGAVVNDVDNTNYVYEDPAQFPYYYWDKTKTRGCQCDPEYGDVDCSKRLCNYGTDVMDQRPNMLAAAKYQVQSIYIKADNGSASTISGQTFALTFKSKLNESFTTIPIVMYNGQGDFHNFILDVQSALESLPNRVIDKVEVHGRANFGNDVRINITFVGDNVQGPQHLITVRNIYCAEGCTPRLTGMQYLFPATQVVFEAMASDFNSYECGRRGKCDYTTGICNCFAGYTGLSCGTISSLV